MGGETLFRLAGGLPDDENNILKYSIVKSKGNSRNPQ
jgi:hypothetical protein